MRVCPKCGWSGDAGRCPTHDRILLPPERRQLIDKAPLLGCVLDERYVLVDEIGGGGGGVVYAALQRPLDRVVAIKILHGHLTATPQARSRFLQEAKALSRLKSRHTVSVYDFGVTREKPVPDVAYMVMEFVAGESLADRVKRCGPVPPNELANVVRDLARSLDEAHRIGIIHRDVKPRNIILGVDATGAEIARVIDFGIARMEGDDPQQAITSGSVVGTPHYMAPELCRPELVKSADGRADVYAVGITMYEALVGHRPFRAPEALGILYQQVHNAPPAIPGADRDPTLHAVQTVVHTALAKRAEDRYPTVGALASALFAALGRGQPRKAKYVSDAGRITPEMRQITAMYRMDLLETGADRPAPRPKPAAPRAPLLRPPIPAPNPPASPPTLPPEDVEALDGSLTAENLATVDTFGETAGVIAEPKFVRQGLSAPITLDARDTAALDAAVRRREAKPMMLPLVVLCALFLAGGAWWLSRDIEPAAAPDAQPVAAAAQPVDAQPPSAPPDAAIPDAAVVPDAAPATVATPASEPPPPSPRLLARQIERAVGANRCRQAKRLFKTLSGLAKAQRYVRQVEDKVSTCGAAPPVAKGDPARVQIGNLDVTAANPRAAETAVKRRQQALTTCAIRHDLKVQGRAILNLRLEFGGGRTRGARIRHSSTKNRRFDACALTALRLTEVAGEARVDVPLLIKPK